MHPFLLGESTLLLPPEKAWARAPQNPNLLESWFTVGILWSANPLLNPQPDEEGLAWSSGPGRVDSSVGGSLVQPGLGTSA